ADMREHQRRADLRGELAEVALVPGGFDALEQCRSRAFAVPADTEAVPVRGGRAHLGMQALIDQGVPRPEEQVVRPDGITGIRHPPARPSIEVAGYAGM